MLDLHHTKTFQENKGTKDKQIKNARRWINEKSKTQILTSAFELNYFFAALLMNFSSFEAAAENPSSM